MSIFSTTSAWWRRCVFFVGVLHHDRAFLRSERADVGVLVNFVAHRSKDLLVGYIDKELMGEGVAVRSFFGEGARNGGNSSLVGELSVEEMED